MSIVTTTPASSSSSSSSSSSTPRARSEKRPWRAVATGAALVLMTLVAYLPVWRARFVWDDHDYVESNGTLRSAGGLWRVWTDRHAVQQYYPFTHTTFWVEYHLWGLNPRGYHVDNVLLHALSAVLLWRLLRWLGVAGAWLVAAIFALHPVHVESVAWVSERKNTLSAALYLSAMFLAARVWRFRAEDAGDAADAAPTDRARPFPIGAYALCLMLFILALLSKTVTCSFPVVVLLLVWWRRGRVTRRDVVPLLPFFAAGLVLGLNTALIERYWLHAEGPAWDFSPPQRCLIAGRAVWFYVGKLLWPRPLIFIYPRWTLGVGSPAQLAAPVALALVIAGLWALRRRLGRGPLVALLFFVVSLFPALGFSNTFPMLFSFVADHYQYLASIGIIALAVGIVRRLVRGTGPRVVAAAVVLGALGALTFEHARAFASDESIWRDTVAKDPASVVGRLNLAALLVDQGRLDEAEARYRAFLDTAPTDPKANLGLANLLMRTGRSAQAEPYYRTAVAASDDPHARVELGQIAEERGDLAAAEAEYAAAVKLRPEWAEPFYRAGRIAERRNDPRRAEALYRRALGMDPGHPAARLNLGVLLAREGRLKEAVGQLRLAVAADPASVAARQDLVNALVAVHDPEAADREVDAILARHPDDAEAYNSRGLIAAGRRDYAAAEAAFARACAIDPHFATAQKNLAAARAALKRPATMPTSGEK